MTRGSRRWLLGISLAMAIFAGGGVLAFPFSSRARQPAKPAAAAVSPYSNLCRRGDLGADPILLRKPQEHRGEPGLDGIDGKRLHGIMRGAQPPADHERQLADGRRVAGADADQRLRRDFQDDRGLHRLG